jgi:ketosteroid isomerase-like protein
MARGDEEREDGEAKGGERGKPTRAEIERTEARAAERARRKARRRKRAERKGSRTLRERIGVKGAGEGADRPSLRERLAAAARPSDDESEETRSEVIQRRISAVLILVVVAIAIMALTDAAPFFDDTSEEERVSETVERFFAASRGGDHEEMCSLFSASVVQGIEAEGATETKGEDPESCAEILEARVGTPDEDERVSVRIDTVRVSGPRAIANLVIKSPDSARNRVEAVELEMGPDGWLLTSRVITN